MTIGIKAIEEAFTQAKTDAAGIKMVTVEVPRVEGATAYTPILPAEVLTANTGEQKVELKTEVASIVVPSNMLANTAAAGAKEVALTIARADISALLLQANA